MKFAFLPLALAVAVLAACSDESSDSASLRSMEERLERMEVQLSRIESELGSGGVATNSAAVQPDQMRIYVSGQVAKPGGFLVERNLSVLAALALAGGPTESADLGKVVISHTGQEDRVLPDKKAFKDVILTEGDVVVVPPSFW